MKSSPKLAKLYLFLKVLVVFNFFLTFLYYKVATQSSFATVTNSTGTEIRTKQIFSKDGNNSSMANWTQVYKKPFCKDPYDLKGKIEIDFNESKSTFFRLNSTDKKNVTIYRVFQPTHCKTKKALAIIVPYRNRKEQLQILIGHLQPILQRQLQRYQIFVVEQVGNTTFNKGRLMNTAFSFIKNHYGRYYSCYIFHDVDMLLENDKNIYKCGRYNIRHLSCSLNKFAYDPLCCGMTVGGVLAFTEHQYLKVNGFANSYWGWGGEDDDMNTRIAVKGLVIKRPKPHLCRYYMIEHQRDTANSYIPRNVNQRVKRTSKLFIHDGLRYLKTTVVKHTAMPLYVHLMVDVGRMPSKLKRKIDVETDNVDDQLI